MITRQTADGAKGRRRDVVRQSQPIIQSASANAAISSLTLGVKIEFPPAANRSSVTITRVEIILIAQQTADARKAGEMRARASVAMDWPPPDACAHSIARGNIEDGG